MIEGFSPSISTMMCYFDNFLGASGVSFLTVLARNGNSSSTQNLGTANGGTMLMNVTLNTTTKNLEVSVTTAASVSWSIILL